MRYERGGGRCGEREREVLRENGHDEWKGPGGEL